ncbi:MAG: hypothetical protein HUU20_24575 [Pirellulales bacterium]|nr:hypothetical protein [Pirellulales bacterium]
MHSRKATDEGAIGHDSFLDIVANIVGILIILVMVVGVRARNAPVQAPPDDAEDLKPMVSELERNQMVQQNLYNDVARAAEQIAAIQRESLARHQERTRLATAVAALEHQIQSRRSELSTGSQEDFDLARRLSDSRIRLEQLRQQREYALESKPEATLIECYPTPLSAAVDDHETHFQLRGERIAYIPLDQLVERFKYDARRQANKLFDLPELTDTIGPLGGFRFRYTLVRQDVSIDTQVATGRATYARLKRWTLIPIANDLGEPIDNALAEGSEFRRVIGGLDPEKSTITIWTYPDSFSAFRRIKQELHRLGFATAGRPLPEGVPISGSPEGSKSAAE